MAKKNRVEEETVVDTEASNVYTYIGAGDEPPSVINFMGMQKFVRGRPTAVDDAYVLSKIVNNPCFVQGSVDMEELHDHDEQERAERKMKEAADERLNNAYKKRFMSE